MSEKDFTYLDSEAYSRLKKELTKTESKLKNVQQHKAELIALHGDNLEEELYQVNLQERVLSTKAKDLAHQLANSKVISSQTIPPGVIRIGSVVTVLITDDYGEDELSFKLVSNFADSRQEVSVLSPMGKAVLGKKVGDLIKYSVRENSVVAKVVKVE